MTTTFPRIAAAAVAGVGLIVAGYFLWSIASLSSLTEPGAISPRTPASVPAPKEGARENRNGAPSLVTLEDVVTDVRSPDLARLHSLSLRLELELFEDDGRASIEKAGAGLKDIVIETVRSQSLASLNTMSGKLYFKELLISRMNTFLNQPVVRDIHFSSFYLQ